jgi:hypothetical protein
MVVLADVAVEAREEQPDGSILAAAVETSRGSGGLALWSIENKDPPTRAMPIP